MTGTVLRGSRRPRLRTRRLGIAYEARSSAWPLCAPYICVVSQDRLNNEWATMQSRRAPTDDEWRIAMINHRRGTHVNGTVLSHHAFGFFVDLRETVNGLVEAPCIMDRRPGEDGYSDDFPPLAPTSRRSCPGLPNVIGRSGSACVRQISLATAGNQTPRRTSAG